nr:putative reverse transcriptase domain, ribonuclease H-like domain protein [Tanacetum cinerariifolium]GEZ76140.1 putative reverse transcriptase domain, ribonuclease H-like domain protein [Tanacetum cinerariifolium]
MPVWCRMFQQTLDGSARGWFKNLSKGSIDGWTELRQQFTTRFPTRRACFKDPTEITKIVRKANETLTTFKERWIVKTGFITGVSEVMKISSFMDAHKCPKLAKQYSDKVPKTMDEMTTRLDDFVRSKESFASTELPLREVSKTSRRSTGPVSRREYRFQMGGYGADRRRNEGRNTFKNRDGLVPYRAQTSYQAPRDQGFHHPSDHGRILGSQGIHGSGSISGSDVRALLREFEPHYKFAFEGYLDGFGRFRGRRGKTTGEIELEVVFGDEGLFRMVMINFTVVWVPSPYNVIFGRTGLRSLRAVSSTIHSMVKFPTPRGVATLVTRSAIIFEFQRGNLSEQCKNQLRILLKKSMDVFTWEPADMMGIPRRIIEHSLNVNPSVKPVVQKRRVMASDRTQVVSNEVEEWVSVRIVRPIGRNLEAYVDDMVIKRNDERVLIEDIAETLDNLRRINIKLNPKKFHSDVERDAEPEWKVGRIKKILVPAFQEMKKVIVELPLLTILVKEETMYVYVAAATESVRAVLLAERKRIQCPIHYVSRTLNETERNYAPLEKLALSLLHMSRRLRRYFKAHPIKVITIQPLKQILNKAHVSGKLAKYLVELGAYNIIYEPRSATKGQVLADFLLEAPVGTPTEEFFRLPAKPPNKDDSERWTLFTDGASNGKGSRAGLVLISPSGVEFTYALRLNFASTNNEAEYEALLAGLRMARKMKVRNIDVKVYSKLVAKVLLERSTDQKEVGAIVEEEEDNCMTLIIRCLAGGVWPIDKDERRALRMKINHYILEDGVLFKKG